MRILFILCGFLLSGIVLAEPADKLEGSIARGVGHCDGGSYYLALDELSVAYAHAAPGVQRAKAAGALGLTYMQMRATDKAEPLLREAYAGAVETKDRAQYGIDLANLLAGRGKTKDARRLYQEVLKLAPDTPAVAVSVGLNQAKLDGSANQLASLSQIAAMLPQVQEPQVRARLALNLGTQAKSSGSRGLELAYHSFESARELADLAKDSRLSAEALDQLAQLYEEQRRYDDALHLAEQGILVAQTIEAHDLLLKLEWRRGRLLRHDGKLEAAIVAYQRAVDHIEAIRLDIPVEYQDGRSSFRETLEPVYLGLADLLLQHSATLAGKEQEALLRRVRNSVELLKQTELEDFLGDRCSVGSIRSDAEDAKVTPHTAVLYPIILPERLELLLETSSGMQRATVAIAAESLRTDAARLASALRGAQSFQTPARRLYDRLLKPLEASFEREKIDTLVVVPDGALRLIPFGALYDGKQFAVQKFAIAVAPGLSMTNTQLRKNEAHNFKMLLAGMSEPGAVVEKLPEAMRKQLLALAPQAPQAGGRGILIRGGFDSAAANTSAAQKNDLNEKTIAVSAAEREARDEKLRQVLALPGVKDEIEALRKFAPGQTLLNQDFNIQEFSKEVTQGGFRVVHIASHGIFGGSADTTFIMAHDDLITIDKLQSVLRNAGSRDNPIELLTLSACETAEGDDRAPLGISGAALKARAKTALGSLWPVSDEAAKTLMAGFYKNMQETGMTKARALQKAQLALIAERKFAHPFFWAPFIVVGSWL